MLLVLYFVFIRDPKYVKFWQEQYNELSKSYKKLSDDYTKITASLHPEKREMSCEQAEKLCHLALDRDLYKLYYRICEKVDGGKPIGVNLFLEESILDTNQTWRQFRSPFPRVPCISDLFGIYKHEGSELCMEIEGIINSAQDDVERKDLIWNSLLKSTVGMKRKFVESIQDFVQGKSIEPYEAKIAQAP